MKPSDKNKKEKDKPLFTKSSLTAQTKKIQLKKLTAKKQDETIKKSLSSATLSKPITSALSTATQTSKYSQMTTKITPKQSSVNPKQSFGDAKQLKLFDVKETKLIEKKDVKLGEIKQAKQWQSQKNLLLHKGFLAKQKVSQAGNLKRSTTKAIIVDKAKQQIKRSLANVIKSYYPQKRSCLDISMTEATKDATQKDEKLVHTADFSFLQVIGEGGYGKVWKVEQLKTRKLFAMKEMSKAAIIMKKSVDNVLNERKILEQLNHNFIANMHYAFNDRDNLYLVMDLLSGGDLRYHITKIQKFNEQQTKFLVACIITAIEYMHNMNIFHRDIKPQNLVFDQLGYLKLTDFGIARIDNPNQVLDASGTPGYMAPEVLCKQVHSYPVDFYALGIICYELIIGKRPYYGNNRNEIRDAILSKQHAIKKSELPTGYKSEAVDFVNKLIMRQSSCRLGTKHGTKQLKSHLWFKGFNWNQLEQRKMKSPFKGKYVVQIREMINQEQILMQYKLLHRDEKIDPFGKYYFEM